MGRARRRSMLARAQSSQRFSSVKFGSARLRCRDTISAAATRTMLMMMVVWLRCAELSCVVLCWQERTREGASEREADEKRAAALCVGATAAECVTTIAGWRRRRDSARFIRLQPSRVSIIIGPTAAAAASATASTQRGKTLGCCRCLLERILRAASSRQVSRFFFLFRAREALVWPTRGDTCVLCAIVCAFHSALPAGCVSLILGDCAAASGSSERRRLHAREPSEAHEVGQN